MGLRPVSSSTSFVAPRGPVSRNRFSRGGSAATKRNAMARAASATSMPASPPCSASDMKGSGAASVQRSCERGTTSVETTQSKRPSSRRSSSSLFKEQSRSGAIAAAPKDGRASAPTSSNTSGFADGARKGARANFQGSVVSAVTRSSASSPCRTGLRRRDSSCLTTSTPMSLPASVTTTCNNDHAAFGNKSHRTTGGLIGRDTRRRADDFSAAFEEKKRTLAEE
mmetsp:Transcript_7077/g.23226  ORF Transcript_7077/g.23226 Transcript_7077/m.23226 type:complete len:225 (+) Transcript_7077:517-1191(+)